MSAHGASPAAQIRPSVASQEVANHVHSEGEADDNPFASVGISLVLGFCFMLLVDQCSTEEENEILIRRRRRMTRRSRHAVTRESGLFG